jgi:mannobiose 2-epimerase
VKPTLSKDTIQQLEKYKTSVEFELTKITNWWMQYVPYDAMKHFHGEVDAQNRPIANRPISLVMITRMLWTFSATYNLHKKEADLKYADAIFEFIQLYFTDINYGGLYWSIHQDGSTQSNKKQVYGMAFAIYAFAEYYEASCKKQALDKAVDLYHLIQQYSYDPIKGGYLEAFNMDWSEIQDVRLSDKDANEKKTMNTHLHVIEAYSRLYKVQPTDTLKNSIQHLLEIFRDKIIDPIHYHQRLFFDIDWTCKSNIISFGHDIESAWLLYEAAQTTHDEALIQYFKNTAIKMASATLPFIDKDGGLWNEMEVGADDINKEKHWWPQAEAMIGFLNAYTLSDDAQYLQTSLQSWNYVQSYLIDKQYGEWFWGYDAAGNLINREKAGFWKCSYHNSRACIEIIKRANQLLS